MQHGLKPPDFTSAQPGDSDEDLELQDEEEEEEEEGTEAVDADHAAVAAEGVGTVEAGSAGGDEEGGRHEVNPFYP